MDFKIDDEVVFTLSATQEQMLKYSIRDSEFNGEMKRRVLSVIHDRYQQCFNKFKQDWDAKLLAREVSTVPLDPDAYAELVFAQPDYKSRTEEDATQPAE